MLKTIARGGDALPSCKGQGWRLNVATQAIFSRFPGVAILNLIACCGSSGGGFSMKLFFESVS
jgi:hypothetical protein